MDCFAMKAYFTQVIDKFIDKSIDKFIDRKLLTTLVDCSICIKFTAFTMAM